MRGQEMTHKQGGMLFRLTVRKWWEHQTPPTKIEASNVIGACLNALRNRGDAALLQAAVEMIRRWYPEFQAEDLKPRFGGGRKPVDHRSGEDNGKSPENRDRDGEDAPEPDPDVPPEEGTPAPAPGKPASAKRPRPPKPPNAAAPDKAPEAAAPKPVKPVRPEDLNGEWEAYLDAFLAAGIKQLLIWGPTQCGKSTVAKSMAERLGKPLTMIHCCRATPAYTFTGRRHPMTGAFEDTPFTVAYREGHLIVLDEIDRLDPGVAAVLTGPLANGHLATPNGPIERGDGLTIIATANTALGGADRMYVAAEQQDGALAQRFHAWVKADYSVKYEAAHIDPDVLGYMGRLRAHIHGRQLRRACSTQQGMTATQLKAAGIPAAVWQGQFTASWSESERQGV